jgi:hypothetical protein
MAEHRLGVTRCSSSIVTSKRSILWQDARIEIVPFGRGCGWSGNHHFHLQEGTFRGYATAIGFY